MNSTPIDLLKLKDFGVRLNHKEILTPLSLTLAAKQKIAIIGPNGAGKSTLLKALMGIVPSQGQADFWGQKLTRVQQRIAYIPQREEVDWNFPINAYELVLMGRQGQLRFWQRPTSQDRKLATENIERVGLSDLMKEPISYLSGGQKQRLFIARALCQQADLLLMDEPFAGVDQTSETLIFKLFDELITQGKTLICVHHDLARIPQHFDWVVQLNHGLIASGPVKESFTAANLAKTFPHFWPGISPQPEALTQ
ncbi:metal ABC transporter ATP-binding protein [Thiomicrospira sp. ALE5]|uniref:metal ABC transporter ATP-binding protein n=1 Tax=Thiomicrospira sp. ALE5 TaxID=748650 RepID=UPI0008EA754D|nr:metal ABC transporter ATP-binding protein [Thiomicrospira sp. ALE5]SFR50706.1 manganese/zinc/iron transport system ATP-binding protein [Thiomicrospira sp. ALE5]